MVCRTCELNAKWHPGLTQKYTLFGNVFSSLPCSQAAGKLAGIATKPDGSLCSRAGIVVEDETRTGDASSAGCLPATRRDFLRRQGAAAREGCLMVQSLRHRGAAD